nr:alcohol dehydrogenase [Vibrio anguillarum]
MSNATTNTRIHQLCFGQPKDSLTIEHVPLDLLEK